MSRNRLDARLLRSHFLEERVVCLQIQHARRLLVVSRFRGGRVDGGLRLLVAGRRTVEVCVGHPDVGIVVTANVRLLGGTVLRDDLDVGFVAGPRGGGGRLGVKGRLDDVPVGVGVAQIVVAVRVEVADDGSFGVFRA